ncbi:MAG: hypothetical protein F6K28_56490 [Microcoleus sp. SIO2G3]|nr:hypothetical protein [Microcoleus sp. SIO2G3]
MLEQTFENLHLSLVRIKRIPAVLLVVNDCEFDGSPQSKAQPSAGDRYWDGRK